MAEPDTEQLLDRAATGDERARDRLLTRHRDRLKRMVAVRADPRLAARVDPSDRIAPIGDDLRVISERPPPAIGALIASPLIRGLDPEH